MRATPLAFRRVAIDCRRIVDAETFHDVFAAALGFPAYYGRNMNAWIDCLSYADDAEAGMVHPPVPAGGVLVLQLDGAADLKSRLPSLYHDIVECAAFVNWRRLEGDDGPVVALSFHG